MDENDTQAASDRLPTGEPIEVVAEDTGRFHAFADIAVRGKPIRHHAFGDTDAEARDRLRANVAMLRGGAGPKAPLPPLPPGAMVLTCDVIGTGPRLQCRGGTEWPEHIPNPPDVEERCTACDDHKARAGALEDAEARWNRHANQSPPPRSS